MEISLGMPKMLEAWLTLYYTPNIGAVRFKQLLAYFDSAEEALSANNTQWQAAGMPASVLQSRAIDVSEKVHNALLWATTAGNTILHFDSDLYPPLLKEIYDPPMILFVQGSVQLLSVPQIAIVGARKPTQEGFYNANLFAAELSSIGLIVTSGLALGIDYTAHNAAVKLGKPTIAVLGTGLNEIYPKSHLSLSQEILENGGTLISEYPLHMPAKPQNFPRRNRIIAGLALGTLVVEAATKSGSLITARLSMEENREVFTIPGSIHAPQSRGCHELIRNGATLVESTLDIRTSLTGWIDTGIDLQTKQHNLLLAPLIATEKDLANHSSEKNTPLFSKASYSGTYKDAYKATTVNPANTKGSNKTLEKPINSNSTNKSAAALDPKHPQYSLYQLLTTPHSINQLVEVLGISPSLLTTDLMMLEIEGVITAEQGFYQQKKHDPNTAF